MSEQKRRQKHNHFYIRKYKAYIIIAAIAIAAGLIGGFGASKIFMGGGYKAD